MNVKVAATTAVVLVPVNYFALRVLWFAQIFCICNEISIARSLQADGGVGWFTLRAVLALLASGFFAGVTLVLLSLALWAMGAAPARPPVRRVVAWQFAAHLLVSLVLMIYYGAEIWWLRSVDIDTLE